jgi:hypothetical protein
MLRLLTRIGLTVAASCVIAIATAGGAQAYVYWTTIGGTIGRADNDGSAVNNSFITGLDSPDWLIEANGHLYFGDRNLQAGNFSIGRANLDGSDVEPNFIPGLANSPGGTATDGSYIYWVDGREIGRANLDGTGIVRNFVNPPPPATILAGLTVASGVLYSTSPSTGPSIVSAPATQGSTLAPFITMSNPSDVLFGVASADGYIYWSMINVPTAATPYSSIGQSPASNPGPPNNSFVLGPGEPGVITTEGNYLYWTDSARHGIGRAPISDPAARTLDFISVPDGPSGVAVDSSIDPTSTSISCQQPTVAVGATITCTATVGDSASTAVPGGTVDFTAGAGAVVVGSNPCTLSVIGGTTQCTVGIEPTAASRTLTVTGAYGGDTLHQPSSGSASLCAGNEAQCGPPCIVPKLKGKTLKQARGALDRAHCTLGKVTKPKRTRTRLVVGSTKPTAGTKLGDGATVAVKLVPKPRRRL